MRKNRSLKLSWRNGSSQELDLFCFSHLRWDFVYQRPQHLLSRCARDRNVYFWEEPVFGNDEQRLVITQRGDQLWVLTPLLPGDLNDQELERCQREMLDNFIADHALADFVAWYYTPMALGFSNHLSPATVVYDCMDELSAFKGASPLLKLREKELFGFADLVFTGGESLYEFKRAQHQNIHAFPSSIELEHFMKARAQQPDPADQAAIRRPRLGFFGVLDERFDINLLSAIAEARPDWEFVMIGPVVKIDPTRLPALPNISYLGPKPYSELPAYIAGWDVALLLFARNESTRFISPTKTPEYLAAGKPVVSTSIRDVVRPYGELGLVRIADEASDFMAAIEQSLQPTDDVWLGRVDRFLATNSWDKTWQKMWDLVDSARKSRTAVHNSADSETEMFEPTAGD